VFHSPEDNLNAPFGMPATTINTSLLEHLK